jgi:hypothetical protein
LAILEIKELETKVHREIKAIKAIRVLKES